MSRTARAVNALAYIAIVAALAWIAFRAGPPGQVAVEHGDLLPRPHVAEACELRCVTAGMAAHLHYEEERWRCLCDPAVCPEGTSRPR